MEKRGKRAIKNIAVSEIILLISMSFAIAFILDENLVTAAPTDPFNPAAGMIRDPATSVAVTSTAPPTEAASVLSAAQTKALESAAEEIITERMIEETVTEEVGTKFNIGIWDKEITGLGSWGNFLTAHLLEGLVWGGVVALGIKFLGPMLGLEESEADAAALAAFGGIASAKAVYGVLGPQGWLESTGAWFWGGAYTPSLFIGAGIAFAILVATYKKEKKKLVDFQCLPFEPPIGGAKCEECNKDPFRPCSEYRCRSLGQACQLLNKGSAEEKCAWVNPKDVVSPTITPWVDALKPAGLKYTPDNAIRPPNRGVKIISNSKNGCLAPFTKLEFGFNLNEPAQCKIDYEMGKGFDDLKYYVGGSNYHAYNHTQKMKLPGPVENMSEETTPELKNDGTFGLYVRCRDPNGNENVDAFVFNYCVDQSPDTTPPIIEGTSILKGSYVMKDAESIPIEVYVNEPSECRWSKEISKAYEEMENKMECSTEAYQINGNMDYTCKGNLTITQKGKDKENRYYFACKDQPNKADKDRNVMGQNYEFILKGSDELNIIETGPKGTVYGNTKAINVVLSVKTDDGAEEGKAICYFSRTGAKDSYIAMFETNNYLHKQSLELTSGSYEYSFRCVDSGGNTAESKTSFNVALDNEEPLITRVYKEGGGVKIVTNEDAECAYNLKGCNYVFKEGLKMGSGNPLIKRIHFAEFREDATYYIKCGDFSGNKPLENECSIIVKAM